MAIEGVDKCPEHGGWPVVKGQPCQPCRNYKAALMRRMRRLIACEEWQPYYPNMGEVKDHITLLLERGGSYRYIARESGLDRYWVRDIHRNPNKQIRHKTARRVLAVEPRYRPDYVSAVGFRRRVDALACIGHPKRESIRVALNWTRQGGSVALPAPNMITPEMHLKMARHYEVFQYTPGSSAPTLLRARRKGLAPPAAWGSNIDDPKAKPSRIGLPPGSVAEAQKLLDLMRLAVPSGGYVHTTPDVGPSASDFDDDSYVDPMVLELAKQGRALARNGGCTWDRLTSAEKNAVLKELHDSGLQTREIADILSTKSDTLVSWRRRQRNRTSQQRGKAAA